MRVSGTVVPGGDRVSSSWPCPRPDWPVLPGQRRGGPGRIHQPSPAGRQRLLRPGQPGPPSPTSISRRTCRSTWSSSTPSVTPAWPGSGWASGPPTATRCWSGRWERRRRRMSPSSCVGTSAETETEGARPAPPWRYRGARPSSFRPCRCGQTAAPSRGSTLQRRSTWSGRTTLPAVLQSWFGGQEMAGGVAARAGRHRRTRGDAYPPRCRSDWKDTPSHANFPGENGELRYGEGSVHGIPRAYEHNAIAPRSSVRPRPELHVVRSGPTLRCRRRPRVGEERSR